MPGSRILVWLSPEQVPLILDVARVAELTLIAAGSPDRAQSGAVAGALGVPPVDDLRAALAGGDADVVWIARPGDFGVASPDTDIAAILAARARGARVATLDPIPADAIALEADGWTEPIDGVRAADVVRFLPLARLWRPLREAREMLEAFGHVRAVAVEAWSMPHEGSLGARLFSSVELIISLLGEPELVDATCVGPAHGRAIRSVPGDSLRGLSGDLTANFRFPDGRGASLVASDQGGRWERSITLVGPGGRICVREGGVEWIGPDGRLADHWTAPPGGTGAVAAIADAFRRVLDPDVTEGPPGDPGPVLASAQAALLSARTGQGESPATILRMARSA